MVRENHTDGGMETQHPVMPGVFGMSCPVFAGLTNCSCRVLTNTHENTGQHNMIKAGEADEERE